jgi:hypothetical protein
VYCNGPRCFLISIKSISLDDLPIVLESVVDRFNVESVIISRSGPVPSTTSFFNGFDSQPDLHLSSSCGGDLHQP